MVTEVVNSNTQSVMERETLELSSLESAQLHVREHLYTQIEKIHGNNTELKLKSLILSRDAQLHSHASSVPSLTVRKKNVVFPVNFPSQNSRQSTPPLIWIEALLWNLINTMELDAPCRGLKLKKFRTMISDVAEIFHTSIHGHFDKLKSQNFEVFSHVSDLFTQSEVLLKATQCFRNLEARKIQIINYCSNLLVLVHRLHHEGLEVNYLEQDVSPVQNNQEEVRPMQNDLLLEPSISTSSPSQDFVDFNYYVDERPNEPPHDYENEANRNTLAAHSWQEFRDENERRAKQSLSRFTEVISDTSSDSSSDSDSRSDLPSDCNSALHKFSKIDAVADKHPTSKIDAVADEPLTLSIPVKRFEEDFAKDSKSISDAPTVLDFIAKRLEIRRQKAIQEDLEYAKRQEIRRQKAAAIESENPQYWKEFYKRHGLEPPDHLQL